ncbi:MAG: acetylornithine/succinylornithine family transaminase [Clostridia bacterium]|nr:acetylornithine/succinylornithine family transaminase [Clostridia bacterium]
MEDLKKSNAIASCDIRETDKQFVAHTYNRFSPVIVKGSGSLAYDAEGNEYIDMGSGIGVNAFGYSDPEWAAAVANQASLLQHTSNLYYTEPCAKLAKLLCERTGMSKVFFGNSGAEANECAFKIARKYASDKYGSSRNVIVTLKNSFHGRTLSSLAATGQEHYHELFTPLTPGFDYIDANTAESLDELEKKLAVGNVCALMIECIQGEGGVLPIDKDWALKAQELVHESDALLIVDEVQTGNGRTGKLYAYMNFGLEPDVVTTAKGLGGGLPIGAALIAEKAAGVLGFGDHGSTFGGNPVCCAGALSIMSRIDNELLGEVRRKGELLRSMLLGRPGVKSVSGMGLMVGIETERPAGEVVKDCLNAGLLCLTAKNRVRLLPALNIPDELLVKAAEIIVRYAARPQSAQ